ncbi:DUF6384 family protein [Rhizobium leguminosarum]|uniref:DUF6384 family protein n=1 Tax=Rhizobium leguminosarum TaxID=384 RepID=UPI002E15B899|nr:DUF6384 family protein [Rhizobium leguminosarum]
MTEKKTTRFASLEAIPIHTPGPSGLRGVLTTLYIRRRRTLAVSAGILACSAAAFLMAPSFHADLRRLPDVASISAQPLPRHDGQKDSKPVEKSPVEVVSVAERKLPEPATHSPSPTQEKTSIPLANATAPAVDLPPSSIVKETHPAPRRIIPVSEAMSVYDGRETAEPPKVAEPLSDQPHDTPFFVEGLSSERETLAFFNGTTSETTSGLPVEPEQALDVPPGEEDMSPTVAIPNVVPTPSARPQTDDGRVEFRIVQGDGVQSGFVLYNKDDKNLRRYFVVARAFRSGGAIPWKFKDIADGKDVSTEKFAVEVSEAAFRGLSEEKKKFGKVVHEVLGSANDDKAKIDWTIESSGNMLAAPEGRS